MFRVFECWNNFSTIIDDEFIITGYEEGTGNRAGTLGAVWCLTKDEKPFKSNIKGTREYTRELWQNREALINKMGTVKFFDYTPDGKPRFGFLIAIRDYE